MKESSIVLVDQGPRPDQYDKRNVKKLYHFMSRWNFQSFNATIAVVPLYAFIKEGLKFFRRLYQMKDFRFFAVLLMYINIAFEYYFQNPQLLSFGYVLRNEDHSNFLRKCFEQVLFWLTFQEVDHESSDNYWLFRKTYTERWKVGMKCIEVLIKHVAFQPLQIVFRKKHPYDLTYHRVYTNLITSLGFAKVTPFFHMFIRDFGEMLIKPISVVRSEFCNLFFGNMQVSQNNLVSITDHFTVSSVAVLVYLDQSIFGRSVTQELLENGLINLNSRCPHGFHVIFNALFRTINSHYLCTQYNQWKYFAENHNGLYPFITIDCFRNGARFGIVDEVILGHKLSLFLSRLPLSFVVKTEKPSDRNSNYLVFYNDYGDSVVHTENLERHQVSFFDLICELCTVYTDKFFEPCDIALHQQQEIDDMEEAKQDYLRIGRFFLRLKTRILLNAQLNNPNFPLRRYVFRSYAEKCIIPVSPQGYDADDEPSNVCNKAYQKKTRDKKYTQFLNACKTWKAAQILLPFIQRLVMDTSFMNHETGETEHFRPWMRVATLDDGGVIHDTESEES